MKSADSYIIHDNIPFFEPKYNFINLLTLLRNSTYYIVHQDYYVLKN